MGAYLLRRLVLVIPTLWAIITINFYRDPDCARRSVDQAIAAVGSATAGCPAQEVMVWAQPCVPALAISVKAIIAADVGSIRK